MILKWINFGITFSYTRCHIFIPGRNTNLCNKNEHKVFSMNQVKLSIETVLYLTCST